MSESGPRTATIGPVRDLVARLSRAVRARASIARRFGTSSLFVGSANVARELDAVSRGIAAFERSSGKQAEVDYVLRRNVHRLEKGLISRPRRAVFATSYIEETVDHFLRCTGRSLGGSEPGSELAWSRDVLSEYFRAVDSAPEIDRAREGFFALVCEAESTEVRLIPFRRDLDVEPSVSLGALRELSLRRRSVRWFADRPVPRRLIDAAIEIAAQSPSACNRQPFEFQVFDDPERVRRVASIPGGTAGFAHSFPVIVAVVGRLDAFFSERDRHLIYIDSALAVMSFMLALETLGLSSCAINTPGEEDMERQLSLELGLESFERPVMLIALGYPDPTGLIPRSQKKPLDVLRRYNP